MNFKNPMLDHIFSVAPNTTQDREESRVITYGRSDLSLQPGRLVVTTFQKGQRQNTKYLDKCGTRIFF